MRPVLAAALATSLLGASVLLGLQLPAVHFLDPFADGRQVDYGSWPFGRVPPLRAKFVADTLGPAEPTASGQLSASPREPRLAADGAASQGSPPTRVVLEHPPGNDDFEDAVGVPSVPFTAKTNSSGSTRQAAEPASCASVRGGTIWYRYTPTEDARLVATTAGTGLATTLAVFTGDNMRALTEVGCDTQPTSLATVPFVAARSKTYWFQLATTTGGAVVFSLDPQPRTTRVSVLPDGTQANHRSFGPFLSDDGRYVGFVSHATNLSPHFRQWRTGQEDICRLEQREPFHTFAQNYDTVSCQGLAYVHDRAGRSLVMVDLSGVDPACGDVVPEAISRDGRKIVFNRYTNLGNCNYRDGKHADVFMHDVGTGVDESVNPSTPQTWDHSDNMSADGRYVAFESDDHGLVRGDTNGLRDVFVRDMTTGSIVRVSVDSAGAQQVPSDDDTFGAILHSISRNGRFVSFRSDAANLVPDDTNGVQDLFMHDLVTRKTIRVSLGSRGEQANDVQPTSPAGTKWNISDDGRFIAFVSNATNLAPGDTNGLVDYFVRDTVLGVTERVSVSTAGDEQLFGNRPLADATHLSGYNPHDTSLALSADGRFVVFQSPAINLVAGDDNGSMDIFVRDRLYDTTTRVSVSSEGRQAAGDSWSPRVSADGTVIAFVSRATNLVAGDSNGFADVFVHERSTF